VDEFLQTFVEVMPSLIAHLSKSVGRHDAEDAVQLAFLYCWRSTTLAKITDYRPWIWKTAINVSRHVHRSGGVLRRALPLLERDFEIRTELADDPDLLRWLDEAIAGLKSDRKMIMKMRMAGASFRHIGNALGITEYAAAMRMQKAKRDVRRAAEKRKDQP
jgi:RNA polymerase sigma factor (sigma-70 family)